MIIAWIIAGTPGIVDVVFGFFAKGGLFMWPSLACSIVSVTIMILRGLALRRNKVLPPLIENEIERLTPGESPERLSRIVHHDGRCATAAQGFHLGSNALFRSRSKAAEPCSVAKPGRAKSLSLPKQSSTPATAT